MSTPLTISRPSAVRTWIMAARPKTLTAAAIPVVVGTGVALGHDVARLWPALAALVGALLIQIGTNFTNDYYDFKKGADTHERLGPQRVTQSGLLAPRTVLGAAILCFGLAVAVGTYLVWVGGWPIVAIGVLSVLSGYAYTGGPFPLGYNGLGDLFVFVFFGLVAVGGTYYVQALALSPAVWPPAVAVGALGTAILVTNNLRDISTDVKVGKRTLAVRLGPTAARAEYVLLLVAAFACPVATVLSGQGSAWALLALLAAPFALPPLRLVLTRDGGALNPALGGTARLQLVFGVLYAIGLWRAHG